MLVVRRIFVRYALKADPAVRDTVERVHAMHADRCPIARSIKAAIHIETSYELVPA